MRRVSPRVRRGGALLLLLVALAVPPVYAEGGGFPWEPPEARVRPPVGSSSTTESATDQPGFFELLVDWIVLMARARPPVG